MLAPRCLSRLGTLLAIVAALAAGASLGASGSTGAVERVTRVASPTDVVEAYIAAINDGIATGDFSRAWQLGGKNLGPSYPDFVARFAGISYAEVLVRWTDGNWVGVRLFAHQTNGTIKFFEGTYTVSDGVIFSADLVADGRIADPCFRLGPRC